jgi:predicted nucleotidyltransferase
VDENKLSTEELSELLQELAQDLKDFYGERYRGLVLYGSYARGEADEGSDVDVLLLLEGPVKMGREIVRVGSVVSLISLEAGYTFSVFPVGIEDYLEPKEPFLMNAFKEGVPVA